MMKMIAWFWVLNIIVIPLLAQREYVDSNISIDESLYNIVMLIRELDLNEETQNGFSITEDEYLRLCNVWNRLTEEEKINVIENPANILYPTLSLIVLHSLRNGDSWDVLLQNLINKNTRGLSLTKSKHRCPVTLTEARDELADLVMKDPIQVRGDMICIDDDFLRIATDRAGKKVTRRLRQWQSLINSNRNKSEIHKVKAVNTFFNKCINPMKDAKGCDYWQSVLETLIRGTGDCDDYAVAKYISLRLLGIPSERIFIAGIVRPGLEAKHAVVLYYPPGEEDTNNPYVIDNIELTIHGVKLGSIYRIGFFRHKYTIITLYGINEAYAVVYDHILEQYDMTHVVLWLTFRYVSATFDMSFMGTY